MEGIIILLLSLCLAVGLLVLVTVTVHYRHYRRCNRPLMVQESSSVQHSSIIQSAIKPLSNMEKKYLLLFMEGKSTEEIAAIMHVEPNSVYTMKYRIRKKFPDDYILPF